MRLGVDVGGTKIEVVVLAPDGAERLRRRVEYADREYRAAFAMLLEQIYRSVTILSGHPYHRA